MLAPTLASLLRRQIKPAVVEEERRIISRRQICKLRDILASQLGVRKTIEMGPHDSRSHEILIMLATFHDDKSRFETGLNLDETRTSKHIRGALCVLKKPGRREVSQIRSKGKRRGKGRHPFSQVSNIGAAATLCLEPASGADRAI